MNIKLFCENILKNLNVIPWKMSIMFVIGNFTLRLLKTMIFCECVLSMLCVGKREKIKRALTTDMLLRPR